MSAAALPSVPKKRAAADGSYAPATKKAKEAATLASTPASAIAGWQYPPLPMGMMAPIPYCFPGAPFFPFMFPPFWSMAAMAGAMPGAAAMAMASASAAAAGQCAIPPGMASAAMMTGMVPSCAGVVPAAGTPPIAVTRSSSGVSAAAFPSVSCTNSVPTMGFGCSPAPSPPPLSSSPSSVCNGSSLRPPEDEEFASFIDSFLNAGEIDFPETAITSGLKAVKAARTSSDGSHCSSDDTEEELCLPRSDSLLNLLGADLEMPSL